MFDKKCKCFHNKTTYLSFLIPDSPVKVLPFHTQEVVPRMNDATLGSDGPCCVNVVACHHTYSDARSLALPDGIWDLIEIRLATLTEV